METEWKDEPNTSMDEVTRQVRDMYTRFAYPGLGEGKTNGKKRSLSF